MRKCCARLFSCRELDMQPGKRRCGIARKGERRCGIAAATASETRSRVGCALAKNSWTAQRYVHDWDVAGSPAALTVDRCFSTPFLGKGLQLLPRRVCIAVRVPCFKNLFEPRTWRVSLSGSARAFPLRRFPTAAAHEMIDLRTAITLPTADLTLQQEPCGFLIQEPY